MFKMIMAIKTPSPDFGEGGNEVDLSQNGKDE